MLQCFMVAGIEISGSVRSLATPNYQLRLHIRNSKSSTFPHGLLESGNAYPMGGNRSRAERFMLDFRTVFRRVSLADLWT